MGLCLPGPVDSSPSQSEDTAIFAQRFPGAPGFLNQNQNSPNMTSAQLDFRLSLYFQAIDLKYNIISQITVCTM